MRSRSHAIVLVVAAVLVGAAFGQESGGTPASTADVAIESAAIGALRIVPAGRQVFDIATGETVLPDGGVIFAAEGSIRLEAPRIRYVEGRYVEAEDARVEGDVGTATAASVRFDLESGVIVFQGRTAGDDDGGDAADGTSADRGGSGSDESNGGGAESTAEGASAGADDGAAGVVLRRDELRLEATSLTYWTAEGVAVLEGPVVGTDPDLEAGRVLVDVASGVALLESPYVYRGGLLTLQASEPGSRLQLDPVEVDGASSFDARTDLSPDVLDRFARWLVSPPGE